MIHSHKKQKVHKSEKELQEEQELSDKISSKLAEFFKIRNAPCQDQNVAKYLEFTTLLIQLCSDIPTIFNFRRQLIEKVLLANNVSGQNISLLEKEMLLTARLIKDDPKSYTLWNYRQWLVQKIYALKPSVIKEEKYLCRQLLLKDEKNFHVWNYRNWANSVELDIDEELAFTSEKIKANPFNFSPYHFRSKYFPLKYKIPPQHQNLSAEDNQILVYGMPKKVFNEQLESVKTAIYLNPKEQAPWIYYRWLLKRVLPVLILKTTTQGNKTRFYLSQKTVNPSEQLKFNGQAQCLTESKLSNIWQFQCQAPIQYREGELKIQSDGFIRFLVVPGHNQEDLRDIKILFESEKQFLEELRLEQSQCRFVILELLEVFKNLLYLGFKGTEWQRTSARIKDILKDLKGEKKTKQYIQKIKQYWQRLIRGEHLQPVERLLQGNNRTD